MTEVLIQKMDGLKTEQTRKKLFMVFAVFVFVVIGLYFYFITSVVRATADRNVNSRNLKDAGLAYQQLEEKYFKAVKKLTPDFLNSLGFVESSPDIYAVRQAVLVRR